MSGYPSLPAVAARARSEALDAGEPVPAWAAEPAPLVQVPWEVAAWVQRRPGRYVARDGAGIALIEGSVRRWYPTLTAACAAVGL